MDQSIQHDNQQLIAIDHQFIKNKDIKIIKKNKPK